MVRLKRLWAAMIFVATLSAAPGLSDPPPNGLSTRAIQLNQGWSDREIEFYHFATEGTNLAPLDFVLHLPEPSKPAARFIDKLATEYGFIPAEKSALNPHGLPVGFAIDERPKYFSDRTYLGLTCSACHTRQLTYSKAKEEGADVTWTIPVHGGPALVDMQRFKRDLYDAFFALIGNDDSMLSFATGVLGHAPTDEEKAALRKEIQEFTAPVLVTRGILKKWEIPEANFGPGNLNALSQGYYNNLGMMKWLADKGHVDPSGTVPVRPRFEGTDSLVPLWFAHGDDWAQWFVEIHHPGPRNWVQSVSTSEVRPPKMVEALKAGVVLGSRHI